MYDVGHRIKELRVKRGYTQEALGKRINKSKSAVSSYENDMQIPPLEVAADIASVLNVSVDYLVGFETDEFFSLKNLTDNQKEIINLLFSEFKNPTNSSLELSPQQITILQKIILLFHQI